MARVMSGFVNHHGDFTPSQADAEGQPGQTTADNRDGFWRHGSSRPLRDEQMRENDGAPLSELPRIIIWPERGEFVADKAGTHAEARVVARDGIATEQSKQARHCERRP